MDSGLNEKEPEEITVTVSGSTDGLDLPLEWLGKAKEWDGPVVLSSPQFVEPKPHKCPVCEELVASIDEKIRKLHGCEGKG